MSFQLSKPGQTALLVTNICGPNSYQGETADTFPDAKKVTATNANKLYNIAIDSTKLAATNVWTALELNVFMNGYQDPTTTDAAAVVSIYASDKNDNTDPDASDLLLFKFNLVAQVRTKVPIPVNRKWSMKPKIMIACSVADKTFQVDGDFIYYTPNAGVTFAQ